MTAKEMFEQLGYRECYTGSAYIIRYYLNDLEEIQFDGRDKTFRKYNPLQDMPADITPDELKAINKQIEEVGW